MKASDEAWVTGLLEKLESPLIAYAYRIVGDLDQAREVVQEAFIKLCAARRGDVEKNAKAWLYRVCRNGAIDVVRKRKGAIPLDTGTQEVSLIRANVEVPETPSRVVERGIQSSRMLALLDQLTEDQREVIRLKYLDELKYEEIAELTGHTVSNVGVLIHEGLKKVRLLLREQREGSYGA